MDARTFGRVREFLANGTVFGAIEMVFPNLTAIKILPDHYPGFLLFALPPGAFILLGFLIAAKNYIDEKHTKKS